MKNRERKKKRKRKRVSTLPFCEGEITVFENVFNIRNFNCVIDMDFGYYFVICMSPY